jgi:predicted kinase
MENSEEIKKVKEETLIKAGLRKGYFKLVEGVYDPGILKAVFLAGGPGSGKSATVNTLFDFPPGATNLSPSGLKIVNSDPAFEILLKKAGYDLNLSKMDDETFSKVTSDDPNSIRSRAKKIMLKQFELFKDNRLGVIVDGTGDDYAKITKQKKELEKLGYDCYMVFVNTTLDVAQQRNAMRARKLPRKIVKDIWTDVQKNLGKFQGAFGKNFVIVDNSEDTRSKNKPGKLDLVPIVLKATARFVSKPIRNPIGKKWIKLMMAHDKATKSGDKRNRVNEELDSKKMEEVRLPMDLERHLSRSIFVIKKFSLNEKRNLAVLARIVESLEINMNQFNKYISLIRTLKSFDE